MGRRTLLLALGLLGGCETLFKPTEPVSAQVASHPFTNDPGKSAPVTRVNFTPASQDVAIRVDKIGRDLINANPQISMKQATMVAFFCTIGSPEPEIFHENGKLWITEGLVRKCPDDRQLAAVLASELGKIVSERETIAGRQKREVQPPINLPIGGGGNSAAADPIYQMELAKYENRNPKNRSFTPPDPQTIARTILANARYRGSDLELALPLLQEAERNTAFERQMKGPAANNNGWRP